jgi:hypothetical protein
MPLVENSHRALNCFLRENLGRFPPHYERDSGQPALVTDDRGAIYWDRGKGPIRMTLMEPDERLYRQWYASLDEFLAAKAYNMILEATRLFVWRRFLREMVTAKRSGIGLLEVPEPEYLGRYVTDWQGRVGLLLFNPSAVRWV